MATIPLGDPRDRLVSLAGDLWNALCGAGHDGTDRTHPPDSEFCWPCAYVREYQDLTGTPSSRSGPGPLTQQSITPRDPRTRLATVHALRPRRGTDREGRER